MTLQEEATSSSLVWQSEYPFQSRWLDLGAYRLHYFDEGRGDPLLMVHGNPTWSFLWRHLARELRFDYRPIAMDHIGCGLSDKPRNLTYTLPVHVAHVVRLIDHLDLRNSTLLAHDWGGPIGLSALLKRRDRFRRIILFNTGAFPPPYVPWRIRACRFPVLGQIAVQGLNLFARAAQTMAIHQPHAVTPVAKRGLISPYDSWQHRQAIYRFVQDIPVNRNHPTWKHLEELEEALPGLQDLPIQLIWGMQDWCFRPNCLGRLRQAWPHAEVVELEDAGHWVTEEAQRAVLENVSSFLTRT
jgi:haloalkane dehalogenase